MGTRRILSALACIILGGITAGCGSLYQQSVLHTPLTAIGIGLIVGGIIAFAKPVEELRNRSPRMVHWKARGRLLVGTLFLATSALDAPIIGQDVPIQLPLVVGVLCCAILGTWTLVSLAFKLRNPLVTPPHS